MAGGDVVRTVLGDIAPSELGVTLIHEHLMSSLVCYWDPADAPQLAGRPVRLETLTAVRQHPFATRDNLVLGSVERAGEELRPFQQAGGAAVVEATSIGIGRDPTALRLIAEATGLHIVAGCGYYIRSSRPRGFDRRPESELAAELIADLTRGIDDSGVRAGVIGELGVTAHPMDPAEATMLRAAAAAQQATGAGMIVHPAPGTESASEIAGVLREAGARLDKVVISHLDERFRDDITAFTKLAESGCRFGFDTFGREVYYPRRRRQHPSDAQRIETIRALVDAGLADRVGLAQDICLAHELRAWGGPGYAHVLERIVPRLRDEGIADDAIDLMLIDNPARVLALHPL